MRISKKMREWVKSADYRGLKAVLEIGKKVKRDDLLTVCLQKPWECMVEQKSQELMQRLGCNIGKRICQCNQIHAEKEGIINLFLENDI